MKTLRDPKWNPHKNDAYRLADGRTIEVVRRQKSGPLGLFSLEDTIVFQDAFGGGEERKGGRLALGLFQALVRRAVVVRAKGVPDATKVRTVARVHFTRAVPITQVEYGRRRSSSRTPPTPTGTSTATRPGSSSRRRPMAPSPSTWPRARTPPARSSAASPRTRSASTSWSSLARSLQ